MTHAGMDIDRLALDAGVVVAEQANAVDHFDSEFIRSTAADPDDKAAESERWWQAA